MRKKNGAHLFFKCLKIPKSIRIIKDNLRQYVSDFRKRSAGSTGIARFIIVIKMMMIKVIMMVIVFHEVISSFFVNSRRLKTRFGKSRLS